MYQFLKIKLTRHLNKNKANKQKKKMNNYLFTALFYLLLFLLICSTLCTPVCANKVERASESGKSVDLFKEKEITKVLKPGGEALNSGSSEVKKVIVKDYHSPVFLSTSNFLVALAGINRTDTVDKNITVLTRYFDIQSDTNWKKNIFEIANNGDRWGTQFAAYNNCGSSCDNTSVVRGLAAAANENKIYLLLVNASSNFEGSSPVLDCRLSVGNFDTSSSGGKIKWDIEEPLNPSENQQFTQLIKGQKLNNGVFSGFSVVTNEAKIIFLLRIVTESDKKTVFAFIDLKDTHKKYKLQFLPSDKVDQNCYPNIFLWESKIILIPTQCTGGVSNQKIKEISDVTTNEWKESSEPFHFFVGFFNDKSDFTTANIKGTKVLLFTQKIPKSQSQPPGNNDNFYLWVTDGNHSYRAKKALNDVSDAPISLLHTNNELLALYQKWEETNPQGEPKKIVLRQLKTQLDDITTVIEAWGKIPDETVKKVCSGKISCAPSLSTAGLVGFLSDNNESNTIWKDEYYYVNAAIKSKQNGNNNKVEKVPDGFTFSGTGVGAKWEVGKKQEEQPYNFTESGFTLLATVEIGKNNNEKTFDNSLLGLILKDGNKRIGFLCSGGNWAVGDKTRILKKSGEHKCEQEETYFVGLVFKKNEKLAIYVDGKKLNDLDNQELNIGISQNIAHFYFGADAEGTGGTQKLAKTDVAITNVLLYNRPLHDEIKNIKAKKREKPKIPPPLLNGTINTQEDGKNTGETDRTSSASATEKDGAETKLCLFPMNSVTVLLSFFFNAFTLLGRYV